MPFTSLMLARVHSDYEGFCRTDLDPQSKIVDCLAMQLDQPTMFYNPGRKPARYVGVSASEAPLRR